MQDFAQAKEAVAALVRHPMVRALVTEPKTLDTKSKEVCSLAKEFDQSLDALSGKCRLLQQIQEAAEKMNN